MAEDEFNQAEAMLRRVSPEGRRHARRAAERRRATTWRLVGRCMLLVLAIAILSAGWVGVVGPLGPVGGALALVVALVGCFLLAGDAFRSRPGSAALAAAELPALPRHSETWLADQRRLLPAPAVPLIDGIGTRIEALAPQLAGLDPATPAAADVRNLLGRELPDLVDRYRAVPATLRDQPHPAGGSPDEQLLHGLGVVERRLDDLTRHIAAGATDELATQGRYLDTKYEGDRI